MPRSVRLPLTFALALTAGCATAPAVQPGIRVRPETRPECAANCEQLGMRLGAIVLIQNAAGCVCQPREAPPEGGLQGDPRAGVDAGVGGGAVAAGAYAIALEMEANRQEAEGSTQPVSMYAPAPAAGLHR